jgi:hypothetical protein
MRRVDRRAQTYPSQAFRPVEVEIDGVSLYTRGSRFPGDLQSMIEMNRRGATLAPTKLGAVDLIGIILLVAALFVLSYFHSSHRMFWSDEIMGLLVLRQPNWHSLMHLWDAGIDSSGIWFYVLGRPWISLFGASEVSLREFSAFGVAGSLVVLWVTARRYYSVLQVSASIAFVVSASRALNWQLSNGRTYGLFLLANSLVLSLLLAGEEKEHARPSNKFLLATFAAYAFLVGSHILGALYAAGYLGMQIAFDLRSRRFRPWLYLCAICSFGMVLVSRANLLSTAALGKPTFWTSKPALRNLLSSTIVLDKRVVVTVAGLMLLLLLSIRFQPQRDPVYRVLIGFMSLDVVIFSYSRATTSIYVDRYLLPFSLVAILLLCELFCQLREVDTYLPGLRAVAPAVLFLACIPLNFASRYLQTPLPYPDYTTSLLSTLPAGVPVVDTDVGSYVEMEFYHHGSIGRPWFFPLDPEVTLDPSNFGGVSGFHEMDNFKSTGLYADGLVPTDQILNNLHDFVVITHFLPTAWMKRRILVQVWMVHARS